MRRLLFTGLDWICKVLNEAVSNVSVIELVMN
jgi:hypothetical protein